MLVASQAVALLARLRGHRCLGVGFFIALILLVCVERRLAEIHYNLRSADPGLESTDSLDGDEIRVRLVVVKDDCLPTLSENAGGLVFVAVSHPLEQPRFEPFGWPEPRAPPARHSSAA